MKTEPNIRRDTVKNISEQGFDFFIAINTLNEVNTTKDKVYVKVTANQLSKAVLRANRSDEIIVDAKFGRNGSKMALIVEVPCF